LLARFYGWSPEVISSLDLFEFNEYLAAMNEIQSREYLDELKAHDFNNMKDEARTKLWDGVKNRAYPVSTKKAGEKMSNEALNNWIKGALGG
jgi:hypothetical protein